MDNCIFCKIVRGEIPATKVYEDDKVLAFKDIHPAAPVHVLIIPKQHISSLREITAENAACLVDIHMAANKVASELGISESGYRLLTNCGPDAGQTVFHLHYHLLGGVDMGPKLL